jgi:hypothetical protein
VPFSDATYNAKQSVEPGCITSSQNVMRFSVHLSTGNNMLLPLQTLLSFRLVRGFQSLGVYCNGKHRKIQVFSDSMPLDW